MKPEVMALAESYWWYGEGGTVIESLPSTKSDYVRYKTIMTLLKVGNLILYLINILGRIPHKNVQNMN